MQIWKQLSVRHGNGIKVIQMDIRMCEGGSIMINEYINELVAYGLNQGLVDPEDKVYVTNRLMELFQLTEHDQEQRKRLDPKENCHRF